jgi:hypothetical protein
MVFSVLKLIIPMQLKTMTHSESVHLCAELKTGILAMPTDTGGLGYSYRINDHHCYDMLITVNVIMLMLTAISLFLLQLIVCLLMGFGIP